MMFKACKMWQKYEVHNSILTSQIIVGDRKLASTASIMFQTCLRRNQKCNIID